MIPGGMAANMECEKFYHLDPMSAARCEKILQLGVAGSVALVACLGLQRPPTAVCVEDGRADAR